MGSIPPVPLASISRASSSDNGPLIVPVSVAVPETEPASFALVGIFHSTVLVRRLKVASPRDARKSVTLRTSEGKGMCTVTASRVGEDEVPVEEEPNENGVVDWGFELARVLVRAVGRDERDVLVLDDEEEEPGKLVFRVILAEKSRPLGPRPVLRSTEAGRKSFPSAPRVGR